MLSQSSQQKTQLVAVGGFGQALIVLKLYTYLLYLSNCPIDQNT